MNNEWQVLLHPAFEAEMLQLSSEVRARLLALVDHLMRDGPHLGRPHADTLVGSHYANMRPLHNRLAAYAVISIAAVKRLRNLNARSFRFLVGLRPRSK